MPGTVDTIDIGQGIKYAKVSSRLAAFHESNPECHIATQCEFKEGYALFSAKVTTKKGTFTGHSMAKVSSGGKKAFEKQETIAVGRALAFAGYLSSGDIASQEEMADFAPPPEPEVGQGDAQGLRTKWKAAHKDEIAGLDYNQLIKRFQDWISDTLGDDYKPEMAIPIDGHRYWTAETMTTCLEALE